MVQFNYTNLSMVKKMSFLLVSLATILILCSFSNSQELANMDVNVDNYEQNYWGKNFDIVRFEILDDDPIVNLVDKKYFLEPQNELIIKDDYAFFITTKSMSSSLNLSTVGLIKINISTNLESVDSPSQIVERIEPIFQGDFYTINFGNDSRYIINNKNYFNESNLSTVVMPIQSLVGFKKNDDFYLTDFNFYGNLANIQHLLKVV